MSSLLGGTTGTSAVAKQFAGESPFTKRKLPFSQDIWGLVDSFAQQNPNSAAVLKSDLDYNTRINDFVATDQLKTALGEFDAFKKTVSAANQGYTDYKTNLLSSPGRASTILATKDTNTRITATKNILGEMKRTSII
jgi:hypothetical protein